MERLRHSKWQRGQLVQSATYVALMKKNCSMAAKGRAWIWDMGHGSKSDQITCYECAYLFIKQRRKTGSRTPPNGEGGEGAAAGANSSINNIKGGGKGGGKGGNRTPPNPLTSLNQGLLELDV